LLLNLLSGLASAVGAIAAFIAFDIVPHRSHTRWRAASTSRWPT
jgi:hypothetical protein